MTRNSAQSCIARGMSDDLNDAQRAHLEDLEAKRRRMVDIRRGQGAAPGAFDTERERKLGELRAAGRLDADQELFLRLCGPEEVDRQHALHRFFGFRYEGVIVPSLRNLRHERRTQKRGIRTILRAYEREHARAHEWHVASAGRATRRCPIVRRFRRAARRRRAARIARKPTRTATDSGSDGSSDPPPDDSHRLSTSGGAS